MKRLYRSEKDVKIAGICGGIGQEFDIDPSMIRLVVVFAAYTVRFMAVSFNTLDSAMQRITASVDEAANSLGATGLGLLRRVRTCPS